jgi:hypothetical protein
MDIQKGPGLWHLVKQENQDGAGTHGEDKSRHILSWWKEKRGKQKKEEEEEDKAGVNYWIHWDMHKVGQIGSFIGKISMVWNMDACILYWILDGKNNCPFRSP